MASDIIERWKALALARQLCLALLPFTHGVLYRQHLERQVIIGLYGRRPIRTLARLHAVAVTLCVFMASRTFVDIPFCRNN